MVIQQIRNATLKITYAGVTFLVDPWLQDRGTGFSAPTIDPKMAGVKNPLCDLPLSPEQVLVGVDFCLVTHVHPDHFAPDYLPPDMQIYVQNGADATEVRAMGFLNVQEVPDGVLALGLAHISKTPAVHGDNPAVAERMGEVHGYFLSGEEKSLYIAGDTVMYEGMEEVLRKMRPDVVAVNCCEATLPLGRLIMGPADIDAVCRLVPQATVIATHLDNVNHALLTRADVREHVARSGLSQVVVPGDGEVLEFR